MNKNILIIISGFFFALTGFSIEISDNTTIINGVRLLLILTGIVLLTISLKIELLRKYNLIILLFSIYLSSFLISGIINNFNINVIVREILLIIVLLYIMILFTNEKEDKFLKGLFGGSSLLIIYYFLKIDMNLILIPIYRLETALNPNSIGMISVMFLFLVIYFLDKKEYNKYLLYIFILLSIAIILMTRSRTTIIMMIIGIMYFLFLQKKYKILIYGFILFIVVGTYKYEVISNVLRIDSPKGYVGDKGISNLAGRTNMWNVAITTIKENTFFGLGPEKAVYIGDDYKPHSFHNAFLQLFANYGIFAFTSILTLILISFYNLFDRRYSNIYKIIFIAGIAGGMVEARLLNFGSPGNLLFLISLIHLSLLNKKEINV